jgi:hypothetical protein
MKSASFIELLRTTSLEDLSRLLISNRNFFRSAELIVRNQTELTHGFRKRRIIVVIGHPAPDHYLACSFYASLTMARQMGVAERHPRFPARRAAANIHQQILNAKDGRRLAAFCFCLLLRTMVRRKKVYFSVPREASVIRLRPLQAPEFLSQERTVLTC